MLLELNKKELYAIEHGLFLALRENGCEQETKANLNQIQQKIQSAIRVHDNEPKDIMLNDDFESLSLVKKDE